MRRVLVIAMVLAVGLLPGVAARADAAGPTVRFATTLGTIDVQLLSDDAPATVANFMGYVNRGDYNGTFFHRSVSGFVIQNGGFTVFGRVVDSAGLSVMDAIAAQRIVNASATFGATFNELPVYNYPTGTTPGTDNLVMVNSITVLSGTSSDTTAPTIVSRRPRGNERFSSRSRRPTTPATRPPRS